MIWDITSNNYVSWHIKFFNGVQVFYVPKVRIYMEVSEPYLTIYWSQTEIDPKFNNELIIDYNDVSSLPASAAALKVIIDGFNTSGLGGGTVLSVTGLNTDNTDPNNPVVQISVDGVTIIGDGTPGNPLVSVASGGGYTVIDVNSTPYTVIPTSGTTIYNVDTAGGSITMNMPTAVGNTAAYTIHNRGANSVVIEPDGAETINGNSNQTLLFLNTSVDIYSDNANLFIR